MKYIESEKRPWGEYFVIHDEQNYKIKRIEVNAGQRLSYQYHKYRAEVWTIIEGEALITLNNKVIKASMGETVIIPLGSKHRIENISDKKIVFIEVQTGSYFGEDDIIRIEDDYNRI